MTNPQRVACGALTLLLVLFSGMALADPPARVGRIAYLENGVDFAVDRDDQGEPATLNWPISSGAILDTDRRGRAEVWIGSTAYRLAGSSHLEFVLLDDRQVTLDLNDGSVAISILDRDQVNDVTVHTPDGSVRFVTPGRYRIDVLADHTELSAQAGQATIEYRGRVTPVSAGQKASLAGAGQVQVEADSDQDFFDNWVADRENVTMANVSRRHVSPHMTGYQDLDSYGDWRPVPEYGSVWYPRSVADDWAPYRFGRWAWVAPWGWTWIDQSPWGFAPFHYGRWVIISGRWAWVPGRQVARPVYAPALVGWIGSPGWSVSFSFGSAPAVGWFPLAPREVYVPAYRYSPTYIRQINLNHVREVNIIDRAARSAPRETFAHRTTPRAVTIVPANLVREGRPIGAREFRRPERQDLSAAPQAAYAPNPEWLKPAPGAVRPLSDERRKEPGRRDERRDGERPAKQMSDESPEPSARSSAMPAPIVRPGANEAHREVRETPRMERSAQRESAPAVSRQLETRPASPSVRAPMPQPVPQSAPEREANRERREAPRMERSEARENPPAFRRAPERPEQFMPPPQAAPRAPRVPEASPIPPQQEQRRGGRDKDDSRHGERDDERGGRGQR